MMTRYKFIGSFTLVMFVVAMVFSSCRKPQKSASASALMTELRQLVDSGFVLFGQANPTSITYVDGLSHKDIEWSDCREVAGDNPALFESDIMWYGDSVFKAKDLKAMKRAMDMGCVVGYCWHMGGKMTGQFYSEMNGYQSPDCELVHNILSDTCRETNVWLNWLLTEMDTKLLPVLSQFDGPIYFRPWHEMNGDWFWWGASSCTAEEYKDLFRLTVNYIRSKGLNNVLFVWAADKRFADEYYPGDEYVDVLGMDVYEPGIKEWSAYDIILPELERMINYADEHDKVTALTEVGCRREKGGTGNLLYPDSYPRFWSENVLKEILENRQTSRLAWVMSWYGFDHNGEREDIAYVPYVGMNRKNSDVAIVDFRKFLQSKRMLTETKFRQFRHR